MALPNDDQVRFDVLIEAKAALKALQELLRGTEDNRMKIIQFTQTVITQSKLWGISWQQALNVYKQLNAELSKQKKPNLFGNVGGQNLLQQSEMYLQSLNQAGRLQDDVGKSAKKMGDEIEHSSRRAVRGVDAVRIALGALIAMLIFNVIQAIQNTFREIIDNLKEAEAAMFNLVNAEQKLSEQGIDITPKGLDDLIKKIQKISPLLTQIQAEELVSSIATKVAPALGLGRKEIESLSVSIALLTVRNMAMGKSFDEVMTQVETGLLSGKVTQGINQLGAKITEQAVKEKAVELQLIKNKDAYNELDAAQKEHVTALSIIAILEENVNKELENMPNFLQTATAEMGKANKQWDNFLTLLGKSFGPLLGQGFEIISHGLEVAITLLEAGKPLIQFWVANLVGLADAMRGMKPWDWLSGEGREGFFDRFVESQNRVMESFKGLEGAADTPTSEVDKLQEALDNFDAEEFGHKIEDIIKDAENAREDLETKLGQKREDIDLEYQRKALDAEKDYNRKVEDINRDAQRDIANLKDTHREEDIRAEQDYQNRLWELRMRYLMDLEDALHARDARQVLRLMKQYAIDKEALERKKGLDDRQREEDQKNELEAIEIRRKQRLEDAKIEYQQKLADQQVAKQRELDDLNTWYERERADLAENIQRKLEALINAGIQEEQITEANAAQVYSILLRYFGPGGLTDGLYQYMRQQFAQPIPMPVISGYSFGGGLATPSEGSTGSVGGKEGTKKKGKGKSMAEGGTLLATRPTNVTFGDNGPELGTFVPLNRIGRDVGKIFSGSSGGAGTDGLIKLEVLLSPDLEARVIENSLNGVADVIVRITDSK